MKRQMRADDERNGDITTPAFAPLCSIYFHSPSCHLTTQTTAKQLGRGGAKNIA